MDINNYISIIENPDNYDLKSLAQIFVDLKSELEEASSAKTIIQKQFDHIRQQIIPDKMEDMGITSANIEGVGRIGVTADMFTSIPADTKIEAYKWLQDNDFGDIIKEAVNGSTFKALAKEQLKKGVVFPDELFKITPYMRASVTKK